VPESPYQTPVTDHQAKTDGYAANKAARALTVHIPSGLEAGTVESIILLASLCFGVAISVGMLLTLPVFYFWAWRYLKKNACREYLSTFSA